MIIRQNSIKTTQPQYVLDVLVIRKEFQHFFFIRRKKNLKIINFKKVAHNVREIFLSFNGNQPVSIHWIRNKFLIY